MAELIIGVGKGKPGAKSMKDDPMGKVGPAEEADPADAAEDTSEAKASLGEAFDAYKTGDRETFIESMHAAMVAVAADLLSQGSA